jgi:penicillin-binding protein 1A
MAKRIFHRKIYKKRLLPFIFKTFGFAFLVLVLLSILVPLTLFIYYAKDLPRPEKFNERSFAQSTKIYDRTGTILLYELYGEEKREIIPFNSMPSNLRDAVIVAEDADFYNHFGIDLKGIVRSVLADFRLGKLTYGGSTISQQLIRSTFLTSEKTVSRKVREIVLTLEMERRYSKDQILEWYLNQIPFGPNIYGVEAASKTYFNKPTKELSVNEAATLAAVIRAPSYLSPYGSHKNELIQRKDYILDRMAEKGYLSVKDAETAKKEEVKFAQISQPIKAPHFVFYIQDYL